MQQLISQLLSRRILHITKDGGQPGHCMPVIAFTTCVIFALSNFQVNFIFFFHELKCPLPEAWTSVMSWTTAKMWIRLATLIHTIRFMTSLGFEPYDFKDLAQSFSQQTPSPMSESFVISEDLRGKYNVTYLFLLLGYDSVIIYFLSIVLAADHNSNSPPTYWRQLLIKAHLDCGHLFTIRATSWIQ